MSNFNISSQSTGRQQLIEQMMKNRNKSISTVKNISVPRINSNLNSAQTGATENITILKSSEASEQKSFLEDTKVSETIESIVKSKNELKNESIEYAMRINPALMNESEPELRHSVYHYRCSSCTTEITTMLCTACNHDIELDTIFDRETKKGKYIPSVSHGNSSTKSSGKVKNKKRNHSSDKEIFENSLGIYPIIGKLKCGCKENNCIQKTSIQDLMSFYDSFWKTNESIPVTSEDTAWSNFLNSDFDESEYQQKLSLLQATAAPSTTMRRQAINEILRDSYDVLNDAFRFCIFDSSKQELRSVCEAGYLMMLGLVRSSQSSKFPLIWRNSQMYIRKGIKSIKEQNEYNKLTSDEIKVEVKGRKTKGCEQFFELQGDICDTIAGREGINKNNKTVMVIPFDSVQKLYNEYCHYMMINDEFDDLASPSLFYKAWKDYTGPESLSKFELRLSGCKGSFNTCEICNNAAEFLKYNKKHNGVSFTSAQREVFYQFRKIHLDQQARERAALDHRKTLAKQCGNDNNPLAALIYMDAMTQHTTQMPRYHRATAKGNSHKLESRVISCELYCGGIETVVTYICDSFVGGGANIMIEVVRQAISDLTKLLADIGKDLPKTLWLQFDNCGENKNRYMFTYLSQLVDLYYFDIIEVGFLVVGHTHSSIDQYFSVISKALKDAKFVGSPLSLKNLIAKAHMNQSKYKDPKKNKPVVKDIHVYYDVKSFLKPYINMDIKYFQVPHQFKFERVKDVKCSMQYKLFSNMTWLPMEPDFADKDTIYNDENVVSEISIPDDRLEVYCGEKATSSLVTSLRKDAKLVDSFGLPTDEADNRAKTIRFVRPLLENICNKSIATADLRMHDESKGLKINKDKDLAKYQEQIVLQGHKLSNEKAGYIFWTKPKPGLEPLDPKSKPRAMFPVDYMMELLEKPTPTAVAVPKVTEGSESNLNSQTQNSDVLLIQTESSSIQRAVDASSSLNVCNDLLVNDEEEIDIPEALDPNLDNLIVKLTDEGIGVEENEEKLEISQQDLLEGGNEKNLVVQSCRNTALSDSGITKRETLKSIAIRIASVGQYLCEEYSRNSFIQFDPNGKEFRYDDQILISQEVDYYNSINSVSKILRLKAQLYYNAEPWDYVSLSDLNDVQREAMIARRNLAAEQIAAAIAISQNYITKEYHDYGVRDQIIDSTGMTHKRKSTFQNLATSNKKAKEFVCNEKDCKTKAVETFCQEIKACKTKRYCVSHKLHESHKKRKSHVELWENFKNAENYKEPAENPHLIANNILNGSKTNIHNYNDLASYLMSVYGLATIDGFDLEFVRSKYDLPISNDKLLQQIESDDELLISFANYFKSANDVVVWQENLNGLKAKLNQNLIVNSLQNVVDPIVSNEDSTHPLTISTDAAPVTAEAIIVLNDELFGITDPSKDLKNLLAVIQRVMRSDKSSDKLERLVNELNYSTYDVPLKELYAKIQNQPWTEGNPKGDIKRQIFIRRIINLFLIYVASNKESS